MKMFRVNSNLKIVNVDTLQTKRESFGIAVTCETKQEAERAAIKFLQKRSIKERCTIDFSKFKIEEIKLEDKDVFI